MKKFISCLLSFFFYQSLFSFNANAVDDVLLGEDIMPQITVPIDELTATEQFAQDYKIRVVYLIPSNRSPQPNASEALQNYILRIHDWMREQMERLGYGSKTFEYETESDGITPKINFAYSTNPDTSFHDPNGGSRFNKILAGISEAGYPPWQWGEVLLVVAEIHQQRSDGSLLEDGLVFLGNSTQFAGVGMVTGETMARLSENALIDDTPYDGLIIPEVGPYPLVEAVSFPWFEGSTVSSTSSSAQGGALHEIGHGLGLLWHDVRNDENFNGILMGNGFRGFRGSLFPERYPNDEMRLGSAAALQLNYNRFLNPKLIVSDNTPPDVQILDIGTINPVNGHCQVVFSAQDNESSLAGALLIRNGSLVADMPLMGSLFEGALETYNFTPGRFQDWEVLVFDTQGNRQLSPIARRFCASGFNRPPVPFIRLDKTHINTGESITLNAQSTTDPDSNPAQLTVEWDIDGDGVFDTSPSSTLNYTATYSEAGTYQIIARLTDDQGASSYSVPIGIRVESTDLQINPPPGSVLPGSTVTFTWSDVGADQYWLEVGASFGGAEYYGQNQGNNTSATVANLPTDSSPIYVRLWIISNGIWQSRDFQYTAASTSNPQLAEIIHPTPGSTLNGSTVTFTWSDVGADQYWLEVGASPNSAEYGGGDQSTNTWATISGLPVDGSTVYVRLWTIRGGSWQSQNFSFILGSGSNELAEITSPVPGSTLAGSTVTFVWSDVGADQYWLEVGATSTSAEYFGGDQGTNTSATVSGLPTDGSTVYVRLWTIRNFTWQAQTFELAASDNGSGTGNSQIISPVPGSTLAGSTVTFVWSDVGADQYWLEVGATSTSAEYFGGDQGTNTSATVSGLPTDGSIVYVRLWTIKGFSWVFQTFQFSTGSPVACAAFDLERVSAIIPPAQAQRILCTDMRGVLLVRIETGGSDLNGDGAVDNHLKLDIIFPDTINTACSDDLSLAKPAECATLSDSDSTAQVGVCTPELRQIATQRYGATCLN